MATRVANIAVNMKSTGFMSGLRKLQTATTATGKKMGKSLSGPMKAGIASAKSSMTSMMGSMKGHMKTAATLGGAFAVGKFLGDAISMQHTYRNIANQVNRVKGNSEDWRSIMQSIEPIANKTGQTTEAMAASFQTIFGASGDIEYTKAAMEAVGTAATATGIEANQLGEAMQLAYRKFGVGADEAEEAVTAFVEKIGIGGMSADDLNSKFAVMAGEAANAGMEGVEGMSTLLGVMLQLDSSIGEKAAPGLKAMFQYLKNNTAQLKKIQKDANIKFDPDMSAFEKVRKMLESEKGRTTAQMTFTADSRVVYDTLAQPFEDVYKTAIESGKSTEEATQLGLDAFDRSIKGMSESTMEYSTLQDQANERLKEDPTVIFRTALNKMATAFNDKRMMDAVTKLAAMLPKVADGFVKMLDWVLNNPMLAAGGFVGAKMTLAFAQGAIVQAGTSMAASFMTPAAAGMNAAGTAAGVKMGLAAKGGLVLAAAAIGVAIGVAIADAYLDKVKKKDEDARKQSSKTVQATYHGSLDEKKAALKAQMQQVRSLQAQNDGASLEDAWSALAVGTGMLDMEHTGRVQRDRQINTMLEEAMALDKSIAELEKKIEAEKKATASADGLEQSAKRAAAALDSVGGGAAPTPGKQPVTPGHGAG